MDAQTIISLARNGQEITLTCTPKNTLYSMTKMIVRFELLEDGHWYTIEGFNPQENGKQLFRENDPILAIYLARMINEEGFTVIPLPIEQQTAIAQYLADKKRFSTMESNSSKLAIISGYRLATGDIDTQSSVHWRYWGKQASRTLYYACSKVQETVYTW